VKRVLGIETSCDETAAAVVEDGIHVRSSVVASQIDSHSPFGGVVPEIASREHLARIGSVVDKALSDAAVEPSQIDGVAVTSGPGLIGSLLVGVNYAKAFAFVTGKPIVGVNHIEGHVYSVAFEFPSPEYPALALIVSGGHTNLFLIREPGSYKLIGRTRDDAAGEAFDKISKLLGLGYPGGPVIDNLAKDGNRRAIIFPLAQINDEKSRLDFSFSGLKTAVIRHLRENPTTRTEDLCASFQNAVVRALVRSLRRAIPEYQPKTLILGGGVACNSELRASVQGVSNETGIPLFIPSPVFTTDNAAMIAAAGYPKLLAGKNDGMDLHADVSLRLQNVDLEDFTGRKRVRYRL